MYKYVHNVFTYAYVFIFLHFNFQCNNYVGVCMCGCFDNYVGVLVICVLVFTVLYCLVDVYLFLFVTSIRTTATE
jgi:hypothetical protein